MAVKPTLQLGDPLLRARCQDVRDTSAPQLRQLAGDLSDTLADWVARTGYAHSPTTWEVWDACPSFSVEIFRKVRRFTWVDVSYQSPDGSQHSTRADGELGELLQHEIDHLEGVLAIDRVTSITAFMRSEFERRYRSESPYRP